MNGDEIIDISNNDEPLDRETIEISSVDNNNVDVAAENVIYEEIPPEVIEEMQEDIEELQENSGAAIDLDLDSNTYELTAKLKNSDGEVVSTDTVDFPIEDMQEQIADMQEFDKEVNEILPTVSGTGIELSLNDTKSARMELLYGGNTKQDGLPSEYTAVDYIESSGTQYIDTGVNADYKLSILCELAILSIGAAGSINSDTTLRHHFNNANNQGLRYYYKSISTTNSVQLFPIGQEDTNKHKYLIDIYNSKVQVDNEAVQNLVERAEYDTLLNYWICKRDSDRSDLQSGMSMKVYTFKMYKENVLVRDFIPCYRNSDNEVGLYDLVNRVFYENQGTGDFTYGSVTNIPNPDYPQNVHTVTGNNTISVCGKNLFDKNNANKIDAYINSSGSSENFKKILSNNGARTLYISCQPNTTYTISKIASQRFTVISCTEIPAINVIGTNLSYNHTASNLTITTGTNDKYLAVFYYLSTADTLTEQEILNSIQIELGSTATTYEPYQGATYPINLGTIELCKIGTYEDRLFKAVDGDIYYDTLTAAQKSGLTYGKWYLHKETGKISYTNYNDFRVNSKTAQFIEFLTAEIADIKETLPTTDFAGLCNYILLNQGTTASKKIRFDIPHSFLGTSSTSSDTEAKNAFITKFTNKTMIFYYFLATPTNTEITDTTLISQLEAIYLAKSSEGTTTITQTNADLPFILTATAKKDIHLEDYVKNTDYATANKGGVIKIADAAATQLSSSNALISQTKNYTQYESSSNAMFISKGTLENVIAGKNLDGVYYGTCTTGATTQEKAVTCAGYRLQEGNVIYVKMTNGNTYNGVARLNVNNTGAKDMSKGANTTTRYFWTDGELVCFVYDGTNYIMTNKGVASTTYYGVTKLVTSAFNGSTTNALTPASLNSFSQTMISGYAVYSTSSTYAVGDRVRYNYGTYECITAISTAEAWNAAHWKLLDPLQMQIDNNKTYKTTETIVGEFLGKPLYRKVVNITATEYNALDTTSSRKKLPLNTDIKLILKADMVTNYNDGTKLVSKNYPMHMVNTGNSYDQGCHIYEDGSLQIYVGSSVLSGLIDDITITLEYTKTTD